MQEIPDAQYLRMLVDFLVPYTIRQCRLRTDDQACGRSDLAHRQTQYLFELLSAVAAEFFVVWVDVGLYNHNFDRPLVFIYPEVDERRKQKGNRDQAK